MHRHGYFIFVLDIQRYPKNHHCHLADLVSFLISIASKKKVKNWSWFHSQCLPEFTCVWFFIRAKKKWNKFSVLITTLVIKKKTFDHHHHRWLTIELVFRLWRPIKMNFLFSKITKMIYLLLLLWNSGFFCFPCYLYCSVFVCVWNTHAYNDDGLIKNL